MKWNRMSACGACDLEGQNLWWGLHNAIALKHVFATNRSCNTPRTVDLEPKMPKDGGLCGWSAVVNAGATELSNFSEKRKKEIL